MAKNLQPASILSIISKIFEKLVNNKLFDQLEKCGHFSDFQYGCKFFRSAADLLIVVSDTIARAFDKSRAAWLLYMSKASGRLCHSTLPHKFKSYEISGQVVGLLSSFLNNIRLPVVMDGKGSLHKNIYLIMGFLKAPFLVLLCSYDGLMTFMMILSVILLSMLMNSLFLL